MPKTPNYLRKIDSLLDQERTLSMADEGGFYAAEIEGEELGAEPLPTPSLKPPQRAQPGLWLGLGLAFAAGLGTWIFYRLYRERAEPALMPE